MNVFTLLASANFLNLQEQAATGSSLPSSAEQSPGKAVRYNLRNLSPEQKAAHRRAQLARAKQKERTRKASLGDVVVTITLTAGEAALLASMREKQRGPVEGFFRRALLKGAVFVANSGQGKRFKGNVEAAAICPPIVDKSSKEAGK